MQKNMLFYFTGTGNSLMAAKLIADTMGESELLDLSQFNTREKIEAERIGIVCPVYFWGIPNIVREFLGKLKLKAGTYVFAVTTMGSSAGNALPEIHRILKASGNELSYGMAVKFPDNYSTMLGAQKPEKHAEILSDASESLQIIASDVLEKKQNVFPKFNGLLELLFGSYRKSLAKQDKKFVAEDTCTGCQKCVRQCPAQNIRMEDGKPVWQQHCEFCLSCLASCPKEAIQIGKKTKGKPRYFNMQ